MGKIILVRPGTTDYDEEDRIVGRLDIPLNVKGQAEIANLARQLKDLPIDIIYSSADEPARESADALGEILDVKVRVIDDLRNLDYGLWQGLPVEEVRRKHKKLYKQWQENPCDACPPAGEMVEEVMQRVQKSLKPVLKRCQKDNVVLVTPDPLRQVVRCYLTNNDIDHLWEQQNGSQWEALDIE